MMNRYRTLAVLSFPLAGLLFGVLLLQACVTTQVATANRLYMADVAVKQMIMVATDLRRKASIGDDEWVQVKEVLKTASALLDDTWAIYEKDPGGAGDMLSKIEAIVSQLRIRLIGRQKPLIERMDQV